LKYLLLVLMLQPVVVFGDADTATLMHRIYAGKFDASGWALAESTNGAFSVKMPGPFNDFSVASSPSDITERIEGIGGKAPNGISFSALKQVYREPGTASAQFDTFKNGGGLPGATVRPVTPGGGFHAWDIAYGDGVSGGIERVILAGEYLFTLTVEWPDAKADVAVGLIKPFIESFKVLPETAPKTENPTIWQQSELNETFMRTLTKDACMQKTIATLSRSGCVTKGCVAAMGGATGNCLTWASGGTEQFCASYASRYTDKLCGSGGAFDPGRCAFLNIVKSGLCDKHPSKETP
jgi:hypothetical protein